MNRKFVIAAAAVTLCAVLTGCGRSKVNLNDYLTVEYDGYDNYGTAYSHFDMDAMVTENPAAFGLKSDASEMDALGVEMAIDNAIQGELDKSSELSNGDTITYHWNISGEDSLKEKFPVTFVYEDVPYTVAGLQEAESFDPFDGIKVTFSGMAPNGSVMLDTSGAPMSGLTYTADKTSGLKNGDTVKVTVDAYDGLEEYCSKNGKIPTESEKEFTVEGLTSYALKLDEIPDDIKEKMQNQANDSLTATAASWAEGNSLKEAKLLGYYFLVGKEGFSPSPYNMLYCVYSVTANMNGYTNESMDAMIQGEDTYYTFFRWDNIQILGDGTCSVNLSEMRKCDKRCDSTFGYDAFWGKEAYTFSGYRDLDSMFNECVATNVESYSYESTVS